MCWPTTFTGISHTRIFPLLFFTFANSKRHQQLWTQSVSPHVTSTPVCYRRTKSTKQLNNYRAIIAAVYDHATCVFVFTVSRLPSSHSSARAQFSPIKSMPILRHELQNIQRAGTNISYLFCINHRYGHNSSNGSKFNYDTPYISIHIFV